MRNLTVKVPEGADMAKLKVGNDVRATIVEAVVLNVEPFGK